MGLEVRHIDQWSHFMFADREVRGQLSWIVGGERWRLRTASNLTKGRHSVDLDATRGRWHQDLGGAPFADKGWQASGTSGWPVSRPIGNNAKQCLAYKIILTMAAKSQELVFVNGIGDAAHPRYDVPVASVALN